MNNTENERTAINFYQLGVSVGKAAADKGMTIPELLEWMRIYNPPAEVTRAAADTILGVSSNNEHVD